MIKDSAFTKLREEEREVRRILIIEATLELLEKKTFDEIGMRDIAGEAGISPASLYRYFPGQTELLMESFLYDLKGIVERFNDNVVSGEIKNIKDFSIKFVDLLMEKEATFQMMSYMMVKADISEELLVDFNSMMKNLFNNIREIFGLSDIEIKESSVVHAFFASLTGIIMVFRNFPHKDRESLKNHIRKLAELCSYSFGKEDVTEFAKKLKF